MKEIFYEILNLSLSAAYLVPVVLVLRLVLKKAPRWTVCLLWGLVALRLVMPFSLESDVSLHPGREPIADLQTQWGGDTQPDTLPEVQPEPLPEAPSVTPAPTPAEELDLMETLGWVWLAGACAMALYGAVSYVRLKLKVRPSLQVEKRVFVCDGIGYPFLLGVLRPKVYLPSDLEEPHLSYVLAHEKAHVKRGDHLWKPLGFALLTIHWFNPLLWVAYLLLCRDIESACDEKVVRDMDNTQKDGYSRALLACSLQGAFHRRWISACPVAFGETGVKSRIKGVLHYKKPAFWVLIVAVLACIAVGVFFLTDPAGEESGESSVESSEESREESISEPSEEESSVTESSEPEESYTVEGVYGDGVELLSREVVEYSEGWTDLYRYNEYAIAVNGEIVYGFDQKLRISQINNFLVVGNPEEVALLTLQGEEIFPMGTYEDIDITGEWLTGKLPEGGSVIYRLQEGEWKEKRRSSTRCYHFVTYCNGVAQFSSAEGTLLLGKYETVENGMPYWEVMDRYQEKFEAFIDDFYQTLRSCSEDDYEALLPYLPMYAEEMLPATEIPSYEHPLDLRGYEMLRWLLKYSHYLSESCYIEEWDAACAEWGGSTIASLEFRCGEYDLWPSLRFTAKSDGTFYVSGFNGNLV
jgi:beta-lactamase regulating signal transducer with metallopeptidase domain